MNGEKQEPHKECSELEMEREHNLEICPVQAI